MSNLPERPGHRGSYRKHPITSAPGERVSDGERQAVVEQLRLNTADGRLDIDEFEERVTYALAARTGSQLAAVLHDLPHIHPPEQAQARRQRAVRGILTPYLIVNAFLVVVWAVTGFGYFWPVWPILGWGLGVVFALAAIAGRRGR
ncbi:MAG: DUF1707 domain-containing protein [Acidimicrobiales bacterium]